MKKVDWLRKSIDKEIWLTQKVNWKECWLMKKVNWQRKLIYKEIWLMNKVDRQRKLIDLSLDLDNGQRQTTLAVKLLLKSWKAWPAEIIHTNFE